MHRDEGIGLDLKEQEDARADRPNDDLQGGALRDDDLHQAHEQEAAAHLYELPPPHVRLVLLVQEGDGRAQCRRPPGDDGLASANEQRGRQHEESDAVDADREPRERQDLGVRRLPAPNGHVRLLLSHIT